MLRHAIDTRRTPHRRAAVAALLATTASACLFSTAASGPAAAKAPGEIASAGVADTAGAEPWDVNTATPRLGMVFETFTPDGHITLRHGGADQAPPTMPLPDLHQDGGTTPIVPTAMHDNGPSLNRIDLVFIGDGYVATELPIFDASAEKAWQALMAYEPYKTYQNFFDGWRIDVASPVSGISNDPTQGVTKVTPLGMHFWCHNIDRLLCVNTTAAAAYDKLVAGPSHVISIAHTTTYGGAGGSITTLAGENPSSDGVIVHEMAHTIAGLGDEYQVPYDTAARTEPAFSNATASQTADYMKQNKLKWWRWLGKPSGDGGTVGVYEGANYYAKGFFRPTYDSEMRTLGTPFNPPSMEALIESFYVSRNGRGNVDPIDSVTPAPDANGVINLNTTLQANLIPLVGQDYTVYWGIGGVSIPGSLGQTSLNLATAPLKKGQWNQVNIYVIDNNPAVADDDFRMKNMTKTRMWWVWGG